MATRSTIAVKLADGTVRKIYSHWDGYIDHNGRLLQSLYCSQSQAEALTEPGDISSLREKIVPTGAHTFDTPESNVTVYYGRDRGESGVEPKVLADVDAYKAYINDGGGEEYDYLFVDGAWTVRFNSVGSKWISLVEAIAAEDAQQEAAD